MEYPDTTGETEAVQRIVHHAVIVKLTGSSYRVKNLMELQGLFGEDEYLLR